MSETLEAQLRTQLTTAMKAKDQRTANLVRMINTKIMERRTAKDFSGTVDDKLVLDVIQSYKKQMEKARADFVNAGDKGKAQVEELDFELDWCTKMLPAAIGE
ncbi:MAG TPA: GatB/YqeY domain-containing protein, partial [Kofleriaceae bacterium]|nr:GatB/YqeY domain-containing protein [Kofleriaceae bacterium]